MTFEIPILEDASTAMHFGGEPPAYERLARGWAASGFLEASDLRIGRGGLRCLVEKPFLRWWKARKLPQHLPWLPLRFVIVAGDEWDNCPAGGRKEAWLLLENHGAPQRLYLKPRIEPLAEEAPEFAQHLLAVLYAGLDALCHTVKPPELLAFARAYWWEGGEDKRDRAHEVMSRRRFDHRVAPISQAPSTWPPIVYHFIRGQVRLVDAVKEVHALSHARGILRPNAEALTGCVPSAFGAIVRWRHGCPAFQLIDHHMHAIGNRRRAHIHGAWRIPADRAGLGALLKRVEATVALMVAVNRLVGLVASPAGRMPFYL